MSDAVRRLKDRATELLSKGRLPSALEAYRSVVKAAPGDLGARQKVAEILARQGHTRDAVAEYTEVVRRYAEQGQFFKAIALCRVVLTLDPSHVAAQEKLAELYAARKETTPASAKALLPKVAPLEAGAVAQAEQPPPPPEKELEIDIELFPEELVFEAEPPPPPRAALPHIPLFSSLSTEELIAVLRDAMEVRAFSAGETLITEGEPGEAMYALAQGTVAVTRGGAPVATMEEGAFFGEMALLSGAPRLAGVVASTDVVTLEFSRESMDALIKRYPNVRMGLEVFFRDRLLANLLRSNPLLAPLTEPERAKLAAAFQSCTFKPNEVIIEEGRTGEAVYLLLRGRCCVFHRDGAPGAYPDLIEGDAFGEISVAAQLPTSAVVQAKELVVALRVGADDFRAIVLANPEVKQQVLRLASERLTRTAKLGLATSDLRI